MVIFGLPEALRTHKLRQWRQDFSRFIPMLDWPGDRSGKGMQWLSLVEAIYRAIKTGQNLKAATTADMEWNGTDFH